MDRIDVIKSTFEDLMHTEARSIYQFENAPNNEVFKIETATKPYIFKIYAKRDWPEDGKLPFVSRKLTEYSIPHAELLVFNRDDERFPNGYLIEECLPGITADRLALSDQDTMKLFEKLAVMISRVHQIKLTGYGYTGSGVGDYSAFSEFMYDVLNDIAPKLTATGLITAKELEEINNAVYRRLKACDEFPPVLCHGDLSTKNILVLSDDITLIDWDDVHSLCWMADIARLTYWMKLAYDTDAADACRNAFLSQYETAHDMSVYFKIEDTLHVWNGLDYLAFYAGTAMEEKVRSLLQDARRKCGI